MRHPSPQADRQCVHFHNLNYEVPVWAAVDAAAEFCQHDICGAFCYALALGLGEKHRICPF